MYELLRKLKMWWQGPSQTDVPAPEKVRQASQELEEISERNERSARRATDLIYVMRDLTNRLKIEADDREEEQRRRR